MVDLLVLWENEAVILTPATVDLRTGNRVSYENHEINDLRIHEYPYSLLYYNILLHLDILRT